MGRTQSANERIGTESVATEGKTREQFDEIGACAYSFRYFLQYVYIQPQVAPGQALAEPIPILPLWPGQEKVLALLEDKRCRKRLILKARQLGLSWLNAAYCCWVAMFTPSARVLIISQGEDEAAYQLERVRYIHDHLPEWMRMEIGRNNNGDLEFPAVLKNGRPGVDSLVRALPSTAKAGSGYSATLVSRDELAKHRYAADNYAAVAPAIEEGDAELIEYSTAWGDDDYVQPRWELAKQGRLAGFLHLFLPYHERPGRDERWWEDTKASYEGLPGEFYENYPRNDVEAFRMTAINIVFDAAMVQRKRDNAMPPFETLTTLNKLDLGQGLLKVWRRPTLGSRYVLAMDPGYGTGADGSCGQLIDLSNGALAASLYCTTWDLDAFATHCLALADMYHQALLVPEVNGYVGVKLVEKLLSAYPSRAHQMYFRDWQEAAARGEQPKLPGWHTDERTKRNAIADLNEALTDGYLNLWDADTIGELGTFIHKGNKMEAREGRHDDRVMALALAWQGRRVPAVRASGQGVKVTSYVG
jgi:hypothetical protein